MTELILLYAGVILVVFEVIGRRPHSLSFLLLPFYRPVNSLFRKPEFLRESLLRDYMEFVLWLVLRVVLLVVVVCSMPVAIVLIVLWYVGQLLQLISRQANVLYQKELTVWYRQLVRVSRTLHPGYFAGKEDSERLTASRQMQVPFVACTGLALIIASFILQLLAS